MTRTYTLRKRAEQQAETRQRIVEAAVGLHGTLGPAQTTFTMVAERAGVQRHTLYAHFPDERSLLLACSGLVEERRPLPDPEPWRAIGDRDARLRAGLGAIYGWFEENAQLAACVLRDAERHAVVREISALRFGPFFAAYHEILGQGLSDRQHAMLAVALSFHTWRTLAQQGGLDRADAAAMMARAVGGADRA